MNVIWNTLITCYYVPRTLLHPLNSQTVFEVNTDIVKVFDDELYRVFIVDVDEDVDNGDVLYFVQYEDGDEEDLDVVECKIVVEHHHKIESGEIKEW